jgi:PAS domain-containing protein
MAGHAIEIILSRQLADKLNVPVLIADLEGNLLFYNPPAEELLGMRFKDTGVLPMEMLFKSTYPTDDHGNPIPTEEDPLVISLTHHVAAQKAFWIKSFDGNKVKISATVIPIVGRAQEFVGAIGMFWDIEKKV